MRIVRTNKVGTKKTIENALSRIEIGTESTFANMTIFPLLNGNSGSADYLTLDEALGRRLVHITEVSVQGSVPELKLTNESDEPVLLLDGEELIGARQNRVLNLTIMAPPNQTIIIPVSCVEAGRWSPRSAKFTTSSNAYFAQARAKKMAQVSHSLMREGEARSDQAAVWADINSKASRLNAKSATDAMSDIYERYTKRIDDYVGGFATIDRQVGAVFTINGDIVGFDLFDSPGTLKKLLSKLVRSYALDAIDTDARKAVAPSRQAVEDLLLQITQAEPKTFPAVGEGVDVRLTGPNLTAAGLIVNGRIVHLGAFRIEAMAQGHD